MNAMPSLAELRRDQYEYNGRLYPYINDFARNPYTFIKARFYMEASAILVFFLLKTKIKPNAVTLLYAFCGLLGGILLSIPTNITILLALFIFFSKGIFDWSDGHFARITKQTSLTGYVLDPYGAMINAIGFWVGLSFYLAHASKMAVFYYLAPLYSILLAANPLVFGNDLLVRTILDQGWSKLNVPVIKQDISNKSSSVGQQNKGRLFGLINDYYLKGFPDDRARTIDLVCLLIIFELLTGIFVTWTIYVLFLFKSLLLFIYAFYKLYIKNSIVNTAIDLKEVTING